MRVSEATAAAACPLYGCNTRKRTALGQRADRTRVCNVNRKWPRRVVHLRRAVCVRPVRLSAVRQCPVSNVSCSQIFPMRENLRIRL